MYNLLFFAFLQVLAILAWFRAMFQTSAIYMPLDPLSSPFTRQKYN